MSTAQQQSAKLPDTQRQIVLGLATVFMTYLVYSYFFQIMLSASPRIAAALNGMRYYSWGVSIPTLGLAFSMLMIGKLSDLYGRRALLLISFTVCLAGSIWSALSTTFEMLIIARTFLSIGQGGLVPLCFSMIGDMFEPVKRGRWAGLLNIPAGLFALIGPTLGGFFVDEWNWRYIFWCGVPLLIICIAMTLFCLPRRVQQSAPKIDGLGSFLAAVASSTMILGFSMAGTIYPWASVQVIGLLAASVVFWFLFIKVEALAEEPILDLQVLKNRTFIIIASASLLSSFGMAGLMIYYPLMLQGVQGVSATLYGKIITPGNMLMNFIGVLAGFILAHTKRYKWMFILGYGVTLTVMVALIFFTVSTPLWMGFIAFTLAGISMGSIPTLNTLVAQYAVPKRLLGVATGALFFSVMIGQAIAPAILGSAMNMKYNSTLLATLPAEVSQSANQDLMATLGKSDVLLSKPAMDSLRATLTKDSRNGEKLVDQTVSAIRSSMEAGLKAIYIIGAIAMLMTFLIICTIPSISIDTPVEDKKAS
jgi:MFS family permease